MEQYRYNISLSILVDSEANFLEADRRATLSVIEDLITQAMNDIDDIEVTNLEVEHSHDGYLT